MKRTDLIAHLKKYDCILKREGGNHSIYINPTTKEITAVPRHKEIKLPTAKSICKDLGVDGYQNPHKNGADLS